MRKKSPPLFLLVLIIVACRFMATPSFCPAFLIRRVPSIGLQRESLAGFVRLMDAVRLNHAAAACGGRIVGLYVHDPDGIELVWGESLRSSRAGTFC